MKLGFFVVLDGEDLLDAIRNSNGGYETEEEAHKDAQDNGLSRGDYKVVGI